MLFFILRLLQQRRIFILIELFGPVTGSSVRSDLVVFNLLRGRDQARITNRTCFRLFDDVHPRSYQRGSDRVLFVVDVSIVHPGEDVFQPSHVNFGFLQVRLECLPKLSVGSLLDHALQPFDDLVFHREKIPDLKRVQRLQTHGILRGVSDALPYRKVRKPIALAAI